MHKIFNLCDLPSRVPMGYVGENDFRELTVDVEAWLTAYPSGVVQAVYQRPDGATYPVELSQVGTVVGWRPEARDLIAAGYGKLELQIRSGETVGKSAAVSIYIARALEAGEEPDPPSPGWLEEVLAAAAAAESAAERAEAATVHQPIIGDNGNWFVWSQQAGQYEDTGYPSGGGGGSTWAALPGKPFTTIGDNLKVVGGALTVDTADAVEEDNTKPVTSAAVFVEVGNIEALLATI